MYNHELILIHRDFEVDEIGNQIPIEYRKSILCKASSVGRNEFYNASINELKPERVFIVHRYEYEDESLVEFEGEQYSVIRTYANDLEEIELICERKVVNV